MLTAKKASYLRGRMFRVTKVSSTGVPIYGDESQMVSKGFVNISSTTNSEEGEAITLTNAAGEFCINETATPQFSGIGLEIQFCEVDPAIFTALTGQAPILDPVSGDAIGYKVETGVDLSAVSFALEVWMNAKSAATPNVNSQGLFGYLLLPFLQGGTIGDFTIENAAITFTVTGIVSKDGAGWGSGPYKVQLGAGDLPVLLSDPVSSREHFRKIFVEVAPPADFIGARPVLDPTDPAVTSVTDTPTGLSVAFAPTPVGTDPMWYEFGDGTWDYAETGSYTHVYPAAGTYDWVAYRGTSRVTGQVTVTA